MPHMHVKEFETPKLPASFDGVDFNYNAFNSASSEETYISTTIEGKSFFLLIKRAHGKTLIKSDKLTRPSELYYTKKAMLAYASFASLDVIATNVDHNEKNEHLLGESFLKRIDYFSSTFPDVESVSMEVGFGSGRHLLHQASKNPQTLYIGLEIHKPSIEQVLKQIKIQELTNIMILDYDARLFLELVPSNTLSQIFVHFPVPWDKKPQRRVISESFISEASRALKMEGTLELRTDSENYYAYSYETFISQRQTELKIRKNFNLDVSSKYEDRWKKMEKNIYDITMTSYEQSDEINKNIDFYFNGIAVNLDKIRTLHKKTFKKDSYFIHFEREYIIDENSMIFRISLGSFDRPEHLYLIISPSKIEYFPSNPISNQTNKKTHQYLKELLNG